MPFRLVGIAEEQIDRILEESEAGWGLEGADRYGRLILTAMNAIGDDPGNPASRPIPRIRGMRALHLHSVRDLVKREHRVGSPRHLLLYRVAPDGVVEVIGLVHDRQQLARTARRAQQEADR
jgi:toxin ParE1/3/4